MRSLRPLRSDATRGLWPKAAKRTISPCCVTRPPATALACRSTCAILRPTRMNGLTYAARPQRDSLNLDKYLASYGILAKPQPPEAIGKLVEVGDWYAVNDHRLTEVLISRIVSLHWLAAIGKILSNRERIALAVGDVALAVCPSSSCVICDLMLARVTGYTRLLAGACLSDGAGSMIVNRPT